jgi:signal transduction histidine kinase
VIRIAVFSDCDESIVNALQSTCHLCRIHDLTELDPTVHDALVLDWRTRDLTCTATLGSAPGDIVSIAIIDADQAISESLSVAHVTDLVSIDDIRSTAFVWRLQSLVNRFHQPLAVDKQQLPEMELLLEIVDHLTEWVIVKDLDHRFLVVSSDFARTVGLSRSEIIGRNDLEIGTDEEAVLGNPETGWRGFWAQDDAVIASGEASFEENLDWRAFTVNRRYKRTLRLPLRNSQGQIYALLVVATDITDRVLAERNLQARNLMLRRVTEEKLKAEQHRKVAEQAIRAKNNFLAAASHDLRQPLHALGLFLAVLERRITDDDNQAILQKIRHSSESLNALFNSLLDISRLDAGVVEVNLQTFSLRDLLISIRDEFVQLGEARGLKVSVEISDAIVRSDPVLFGRIVRNLLHNAITHTKQGSVSVRCCEQENEIQIAVSDTGPGIPEAQYDAIFSEYYQLDNSQNNATRGLGLGLAIVRKMSQLLGIEVQLRSALNKGSTFTITVPLGNLEDVVQSGSPLHYLRLAGIRILFIDDEPDIREGLTLILNGFRCYTLSAESAAQALNMLKHRNIEPDIMIVDYRLRDGETGNAAINMVREHFNRSIPAVIVTGDTSKSRLQEAKQTGCRLLHKPVDAEELVRTIATVLQTELVVE